MVNHVRTLLLDLPGSGIVAGVGEDYIPPGYRPAPPPASVAAARAVLFGAAPDRRMRLIRIRQYLTVLHAGPLAEFVARDDPRVTYLPLGGAAIDFPVVVAPGPIGHDRPLTVTGTPPVEGGSGRTVYAWTVSREADGVDVARAGEAPARIVDNFTDGLSAPIRLPGSGLSAYVPGAAGVGDAWEVTAAVRPTAGLPAVTAALGSIGAAALADLFGAAPPEPRATWKALWESDMPLPHRLGAALLATAWRTDAARNGGGA